MQWFVSTDRLIYDLALPNSVQQNLRGSTWSKITSSQKLGLSFCTSAESPLVRGWSQAKPTWLKWLSSSEGSSYRWSTDTTVALGLWGTSRWRMKISDSYLSNRPWEISPIFRSTSSTTRCSVSPSKLPGNMPNHIWTHFLCATSEFTAARREIYRGRHRTQPWPGFSQTPLLISAPPC